MEAFVRSTTRTHAIPSQVVVGARLDAHNHAGSGCCCGRAGRKVRSPSTRAGSAGMAGDGTTQRPNLRPGSHLGLQGDPGNPSHGAANSVLVTAGLRATHRRLRYQPYHG